MASTAAAITAALRTLPTNDAFMPFSSRSCVMVVRDDRA